MPFWHPDTGPVCPTWRCGKAYKPDYLLQRAKKLDANTLESWFWAQFRMQDHPIRCTLQATKHCQSKFAVSLLESELLNVPLKGVFEAYSAHYFLNVCCQFTEGNQALVYRWGSPLFTPQAPLCFPLSQMLLRHMDNCQHPLHSSTEQPYCYSYSGYSPW